MAVATAASATNGLAAHLGECFAHMSVAAGLHHQFNGTWIVPVGALLQHTAEWADIDRSRVLGLMEGASPISAGRTPELEGVVDAIRSDAAAARLLDAGGSPDEVLANLRTHAGDVGRAISVFLDTFGHLTVGGFDPIDAYALERPEAVLAQIRAAVGREEDPAREQRVRDETASVRSAIPVGHRARFDQLLSEARFAYRIKDERGVYNNDGANGLVRRAVMEGGRRLVAAGVLANAEHLLEGDLHEIEAAIASPAALDAVALADRYDFRIRNSDMRPPATLGTPLPQVPLGWLPEPVQRVQRAFAAARAAIAEVPVAEGVTGQIIRGAAAGAGRYEGCARVILAAADYHRLEQGDVLVTTMTTPAISAWMTLIGAIVTDHGGPLSHAAIVAREFGIPAVVGTGEATSAIADGERVVVDGLSGTVERVS
ncbi:MAG: PEP-utilizing enzyme [Dehalococcoidia bacterium]